MAGNGVEEEHEGLPEPDAGATRANVAARSSGVREMRAAFERGDYASARARASELIGCDDPDADAAADDVLRATEPDRLAGTILTAALLMTLAIASFFLGGGPAGP